LAGEGDELVLHGRRQQALAELAADLARVPGAAPEPPRTILADLADLAQARGLAEAIIDDQRPLDVLVNNAGVGDGEPDGTDRRTTVDGHELRFGVNYLAPALLTLLLLATLREHGSTRVVNVASLGQAPIDFDDPMLTRGYSGRRAYAQSKLALIAFGFILARRERAQRVTVNSLHPGTYMPTKMVLQSIASSIDSLQTGVRTTHRLVADPALADTTGLFFDPDAAVKAQPQAYDPDAQQRLWTLTHRLIGLDPGSDPLSWPASELVARHLEQSGALELLERARSHADLVQLILGAPRRGLHARQLRRELRGGLAGGELRPRRGVRGRDDLLLGPEPLEPAASRALGRDHVALLRLEVGDMADQLDQLDGDRLLALDRALGQLLVAQLERASRAGVEPSEVRAPLVGLTLEPLLGGHELEDRVAQPGQLLELTGVAVVERLARVFRAIEQPRQLRLDDDAQSRGHGSICVGMGVRRDGRRRASIHIVQPRARAREVWGGTIRRRRRTRTSLHAGGPGPLCYDRGAFARAESDARSAKFGVIPTLSRNGDGPIRDRPEPGRLPAWPR
jgi:NAD(P)-dependent dehydrogenase (short-subunit alcohol dehydrogenase family)